MREDTSSSPSVRPHRRPLAVVSGGSRGLGLLSAHQLASRGYDLALISRTKDDLDKASASIQDAFPAATVGVYPCDLTDRSHVQETVKNISGVQGPIDVLLCVAGIIQVGPAQNVSLELFDSAVDIMLTGTINLTWAVIPSMRELGRGRIGVVSSIGGAIAVPHMLPYSTAKFALRGFSEGLRAELSTTGITVTTILPGLMRTGSQDRAQFIGQKDREYSWFASVASLPGISMNAERAASQLVNRTLRGKTHALLTPAAQIGVRVHGLFPEATVHTLGLTNRLLPKASKLPDASKPQEGRELGGLRNSPVIRTLTWLGQKASQRNHET